MSQSSQKRKYNDDTNTVSIDEEDSVFYSVTTIVENMDGNEVMFKFFSNLDLALKYKKRFIIEEVDDCPCEDTRKQFHKLMKAKNFFQELSFEGESYDKKFSVNVEQVLVNGPRDNDGAFYTVIG